MNTQTFVHNRLGVINHTVETLLRENIRLELENAILRSELNDLLRSLREVATNQDDHIAA